ncbi:MAG: hypothetical protein CMQ34_15180 [Gammaproteobacteria bacterium]|nr:hypothetical protein [Gammaproteobacteria bacterium]MBC55169.1 hypothetical protein [Gammaproteobacteria bacterium]|tara:strand:+ start:350 stop:757 length:408 start_codon:yes stop_codon:yes gene_type:complete
MNSFKRRYPAYLLVIGLFILSGTSASAQDLSGQWRGTLVAAQYDPIDVVFNLNMAGSDAGHTGTLDIPSQFRSGLPIDSISIRDRQITIRLSSIQVEYYGNLVLADNGDVIAIEGDWSQSGEYVPLRLVASTAPG